MSLHYRTQGFILKKEDFREADYFFTIFTRDFGKLKLLARGVKKMASKLRVGLAVFNFSEIEFIRGRSYQTLTDAILISRFKNVRRNLARTVVALKISAIADLLIGKEERDDAIWNLLYQTFLRLDKDKLGREEPAKIYFYFLWRLIALLGYQPELYVCCGCRKKLAGLPQASLRAGKESGGVFYFSSREGGVLCADCLMKCVSTQDRRVPIDRNLIKILRIILGKSWGFFLKLRIAPHHRESLNFISGQYLNHLLSASKDNL